MKYPSLSFIYIYSYVVSQFGGGTTWKLHVQSETIWDNMVTTLRQFWDNFETTLQQLWQNFSTTWTVTVAGLGDVMCPDNRSLSSHTARSSLISPFDWPGLLICTFLNQRKKFFLKNLKAKMITKHGKSPISPFDWPELLICTFLNQRKKFFFKKT